MGVGGFTRTTFRKCTGRSTKLTDMGIPKENLGAGRAHHPAAAPALEVSGGAHAGFVIATGTAGVLAGLASDKLDGTARTWALGTVLVIWLGMAGWFLVRPLLSWKTTFCGHQQASDLPQWNHHPVR